MLPDIEHIAQLYLNDYVDDPEADYPDWEWLGYMNKSLPAINYMNQLAIKHAMPLYCEGLLRGKHYYTLLQFFKSNGFYIFDGVVTLVETNDKLNFIIYIVKYLNWRSCISLIQYSTNKKLIKAVMKRMNVLVDQDF